MAVRAPHLYPLARGFVLGSFVVLGRELEEGAELPFAFEEHVERRGPSLYELRPLVRSFVEAREAVLRAREDARLAIEELRREPAAAIFARAHAGTQASEDEALFRTVLLGLLISTAEACGGFDWHDEAFDRAYAELESLALRRAAEVRRRGAARRALDREARPSSEPAWSCARSSRESSRRTGPSRGGSCPAASEASSTAPSRSRFATSSTRARRPRTQPRRSPTRSARSA